jgi:hypothetical protein
MPRRSSAAEADAYCPHCHLPIARSIKHPWPRAPVRCEHCRLLIGPERARRNPEADPGARGSAAGVFAHEARRGGAEGDVSDEEVRRGIRAVAEQVGAQPERLLMLQYRERAAVDRSLPSLRDVYAAYGTWKRARRAAAD